MNKEDFENISLDLQRLAFNLADELETLNYHSRNEAVGDMGRGVMREGLLMASFVKSLIRNRDKITELFPELPHKDVFEEIFSMDELLEFLRKCSGEHKNYREFLDNLLPLIQLCGKWGDRDPLRVYC